MDFKDVERVFKNSIAKTEKEIRMLEEDDCMVLLMLEKLMDKSKLKLCKIETLLNETIRIEQKITGKLHFNDTGKEINDKTNIVISRTVVTERKRKNHTELRKFVYDRRLPELFEYFESDEIQLEHLQNELNAYNKAKQEVFDSVFKLETKIVEADCEGLKKLFTDENGNALTGNIQHKPYVQWLKNQGLIDENKMLFMNMVRNSFSHNQFPQRKAMEIIIPTWEAHNFGLQISATHSQLISSITKGINKLTLIEMEKALALLH